MHIAGGMLPSMTDDQKATTDEAEAAEAPRPRRRGIYVLPNAITLAALFAGFYAIVMAMNGRFEQSCIGIFCAAVLDSLDGRVARMTNSQSAFGEQMDSLCDMVSFGAAPAIIVYTWAFSGLGKLGWIRRQQAKFAEQPRQSAREMVNGESHYFLGRRYRLRVHEQAGKQFVAIHSITYMDL